MYSMERSDCLRESFCKRQREIISRDRLGSVRAWGVVGLHSLKSEELMK